MEMQNVLDKLREIENPSEDQQAAITSATKMTQAPEIDAAVVETTATGDNVYQQYAPTTEPNDIAKLAGLETLAVVTTHSTPWPSALTFKNLPALPALILGIPPPIEKFAYPLCTLENTISQ